MQRRYVKTDTAKQQIEQIIELKKLGVPNRYVARRFGVSERFMRDILKLAGRSARNGIIPSYQPQ